MALNDREWSELAEQGLKELIEGAEVVTEKMDKDGCVHELRSKCAPNIDAIKFALKNRSKGKWADKVEISSTQVNINLTASYNQVKELMRKKKEEVRLIQENKEQIIDAEVVNADSKADN